MVEKGKNCCRRSLSYLKFWKCVTLGVLFLAIFLPLSSVQAEFSDISEYRWRDSVLFLQEQGVVQGYADGSYQPRASVNRAEFTKILMEAAYPDQEFPVERACFSDVPNDSWFSGYVCSALRQGVINGYPNGYFSPDAPINQAEALKILTNLFFSETDLEQGEQWYDPYFFLFEDNGILYFNTVKPHVHLITRGQMAYFTAKILDPESTDQISAREFEASDRFDPLSNETDIPRSVLLPVPFTPQAPFGEWKPPYDEACEESSLIMINHFLRHAALSREQADEEIVALVDWETRQGYGIDIGAEQVATVARDYYGLEAKVYTDEEVTIENMQKLLAAGYPILLPVAGRELNNPYFIEPGPPYHMIVVIGYDDEVFFAHDPGTEQGGDFPYEINLLYNAIHDWTGSKSTVLRGGKAMTVLQR